MTPQEGNVKSTEPKKLRELRELLRAEVRELMDAPGPVDDSVPFEEYGLSSLDNVTISGRIEDAFGIEIDPSIMFRFKTIDGVCLELAPWLAGRE